ncbi:hypothetical protein T10_9514 [Trichinella papuae]|uniref:Uncharacterized protein n=1 Tax=Trichinella papuae TaxID=268474 RepID=A0A0V1N283_9BILA|nr:hypothetical protein T10_9514 [Trichinella papuae]
MTSHYDWKDEFFEWFGYKCTRAYFIHVEAYVTSTAVAFKMENMEINLDELKYKENKNCYLVKFFMAVAAEHTVHDLEVKYEIYLSNLFCIEMARQDAYK